MKIRLSKALATSGIASRRKADALIESGHVRVNGQIEVHPYTPVDLNSDLIDVKGKPIHVESKIYYLMNKPIGYLCAHEKNKRTIYELLPDSRRLFSAGRLDKMTSGLILLTNDGDFVQKLIHPSSNVEKEYHVLTNRPISNVDLKKISGGCKVEGVSVKPKKLTLLNPKHLSVTVMEGKKREVRHLVQFAGLKVMALKRVRIGGMHLGRLKEGTYRVLSKPDLDRFFS